MAKKRSAKKNVAQVVIYAARLELLETKAEIADGILQGDAKSFEFHITETEVEAMFVDVPAIEKTIPDDDYGKPVAIEDAVVDLLADPPKWLLAELKSRGWKHDPAAAT